MVRMEVRKIPKFRKLTKSERILIAQWKNNGYSNKKIARFLGRSVSSLGREIKRNSFQGKIYEPLHTQAKAEERKQRAWKAKHPLKNPWIYEYVLEKLREGWSPEQISGRLKHDHPQAKSWWICQETIYRFIYHPDNKDQAWWEYLRRKQKKRRKKTGRKSQRVRIPERVSIHLRSEIIEQRKEIGHWEGDILVGLGRKTGLHTAYERLSSLVRMEKMSSLKAQESIQAQMRIYQALPEKARKSTTLDNGSEHIYHPQLKKRL